MRSGKHIPATPPNGGLVKDRIHIGLGFVWAESIQWAMTRRY